MISVFYGLFILKFLSIYLNQNDFSNYFIIFNLVLYFSTIFFSIQGSSILRFYYIYKIDIIKLYGMLNTFSIIILFFLGLILIFLNIFDLDKILLFILFTLSYGFYMNQINLFRIKQLFNRVLIISLSQLIIAITLLLIFKNNLNLNIVLFSISISFLISFILSSYKNYSIIFHKISLKFLKKYNDVFNYSIPIGLIALFNFMLSSLDQYFLKLYGHNDSLSAYIANYNIAEKSIIVFLSIITLVYVPKIFKKYDNLNLETFKDVFNTVFVFTLISLVILIILFYNKELLTILFTSKLYIDYSWVIPLIGIAGVFFGINSLISEILTVRKKTYLLLISYFFGIFINTILNFIFIEKYGVVAAVSSSIISYISLTLITLLFIRREYIQLKNENR